MAIIIEELTDVAVRRELYAADIRIRGNPDDSVGGVVSMDMAVLEYHNNALIRTEPLGLYAEPVSNFVTREFVIGDKTITGAEVAQLIREYVVTMHAERTQQNEPTE